MPHSQYPPAYLRYLRARLWNLGRPGFWGTAIFLFVIGFVIREYWLNPNIFTHKQNTEVASPKPGESSFSEEDKAVVADIDNLPVLLNDFEQATLSITTINPLGNTQTKKSEGLIEDVINKQNAAASKAKSNPGLGIVNSTPSPNVKNPFVLQAENLLRSGTGDGGQFLGVNSLTTSPEPTETTTSSSWEMGLTNKTKNNQNPVLINPLQAEINQATNQNFSRLNNSTSSQINPLGQTSSNGATMMLPSQSLPPGTGMGYTQPTVTNQPQNPYSNYNGVQTLPNVVTPSTAVLPVTPAAPNNISPDSVQSSTQSITNNTTPVGYANYGNTSLQQPNQLPTSTFSNPSLEQPNQLPQSNDLYPRRVRGYRR
ncbi:hypothetical protein [Cylindrospermum sp. FACHB-282]|uniref:hypothetical protein n=1 Tax=Cylindrospermum sp. FACHB-282 TaxID=2692794 RepID=UPI0016886A83|nr:hypothetical protein [Cylindrospermum sp. FACHB-282]MBD2388361.1 hypothetical protein [Cylindrospermum sp. FACHB-282]